MKEIVVLYSGGTDSTCAAALMAKEFDKVRLLTYKRFGLFCVDNSKNNVIKLKNTFGDGKFSQEFINIDKLFKEVSYSRYWYYLKKYRFFLLSTCGLCKLTMHLRTLLYCLENKINCVCDGANKNAGNGYFPDQMPSVVEETRKMYARYGIQYLTPVFDYNEPAGMGWLDKLGIKNDFIPVEEETKKAEEGGTAGAVLYDMGIFPLKNIKGSKLDHHVQARCFQLILFNIFLYGYYLPSYGEPSYREKTFEFFKEKIRDGVGLVASHLKKIPDIKLEKDK